MNIYKLNKDKALLIVQTKNKNTTTFKVDRDIVCHLVAHDWKLRSNGTAISKYTGKALSHYIFMVYNGWKPEPRRIKYKDEDYTNCQISNLRGIL